MPDDLSKPGVSSPGIKKSVTIPLATAQTIFWASSFYLLPALLPTLEKETSWSKLHITGAFTAGLILSACASPFVGRGIDLGYGRTIMASSAVLSAFTLIIFSTSLTLVALYTCWMLLGLCMAGMLYEPCFAIVTRHFRKDARKVITHITLIAGFAGTFSFPLANTFAHHFGWERAVQIFAFLMLFAGFPLAWAALRNLSRTYPIQPTLESNSQTVKNTYGLRFWCLAFAFTLGGINQGMITTHLLPLLAERGISPTAAIFAAMLVGPMQVVGRFTLMNFENVVSARTTSLICLGGLMVSTFSLYIAGATLPLIFLATSLQGATWGLISIARPSITREMLGQENFGAISGKMGGIYVLGLAVAPALGSQFWQLGGYNTMLLVGIVFSGTGFVLLKLANQAIR